MFVTEKTKTECQLSSSYNCGPVSRIASIFNHILEQTSEPAANVRRFCVRGSRWLDEHCLEGKQGRKFQIAVIFLNKVQI